MSMTAIRETIHKDVLCAMKSGDAETRDVLRLVEGVLRNKEIEFRGMGKEMSEEDALAVLSQQIKQRKESVRQYTEGKREDLAGKEQKELEIIEKYLPDCVSQEEVDMVIASVAQRVRPQTMADMGRCMGSVMSELKLKGLVDGDLVRKRVESYIQSLNTQ
jgi:uncharacterized protein YqeY